MSGREPDARRSFDLARAVIAGAPFLALGVFALLGWADWGRPPDAKAERWREGARGVGGFDHGSGRRMGCASRRRAASHERTGCDAEAWFVESTEARRARWRRETTWFQVQLRRDGGLVCSQRTWCGRTQKPFHPDRSGVEGSAPLRCRRGGELPVPRRAERIPACAVEEGGWSTSAGDIERIQVLRRQLRSRPHGVLGNRS